MNIQIVKIIPALLVGFVVGILADMLTLSGVSHPKVPSTFSIGFFIIVPVTVFILSIIFSHPNLRSRGLIIFTSAFSFFMALSFGFWFFFKRIGGAGTIGDMDGLLFVAGIIPAIIIGMFFGVYFTRILKN